MSEKVTFKDAEITVPAKPLPLGLFTFAPQAGGPRIRGPKKRLFALAIKGFFGLLDIGAYQIKHQHTHNPSQTNQRKEPSLAAGSVGPGARGPRAGFQRGGLSPFKSKKIHSFFWPCKAFHRDPIKLIYPNPP